MNHNKSYNQNNTSHDNTFNFGNQLDISNGKKDKTGEMFFKEAYDFDDFQNIGDQKTVKSSNYKGKRQNMSNILKKDDQFSSKVIGNSILNDFQMSGTGFHTKKNLDESLNKVLSEIQKQPQFGDRKFSLQSPFKNQQPVNPNPQFNTQNENTNLRGTGLSYSKSNAEIQNFPLKSPTKTIIPQKVQNVVPQYEDFVQSFRKKQNPAFKEQNLITKQEEYRQLISMINFYKSQSQKISYERMVLEEESIRQMINLTNSQAFQQQIKNNLDEITLLNNQIQKERAIQKKLTRVISQLQEEYNQIVDSVQQMDFQRPPIIKDQAKVLMDQINQLKKQFRDLQIDTGSLNLSCTIPAIGTLNSIDNRMGQSQRSHLRQNNLIPQEQETQNYLNSLLQEIHIQNSLSEDPQFLKNLKLACLKDEWTLFSNKEIIVSIDYKTCPLIKMRIGNKTNQQLRKFTIQIQVRNVSVKYMQNEIINKKAFILEGIKVDPDNLNEVFIKINLSYQLQQTPTQLKQIKLYCPTGIMNFGEFTPLTFKQFQSQMTLPLPILQSPLKPMDRNFINSLEQIMLYIPNLRKCEGNEDKIFGLFMSVFNEGTLVLVEQNSDLIKIRLKNGNRSLLKLLQFILTV